MTSVIERNIFNLQIGHRKVDKCNHKLSAQPDGDVVCLCCGRKTNTVRCGDCFN